MPRRSLIVFAKLPRTGEVKTRLGHFIGMEKAVEVYKLFAEHAFTLADDVRVKDVQVYVFYAPGSTEDDVKNWVGRSFRFFEQMGNDLGERMKNAFDTTFADGADQTLIIGTDVPELDATTIHSAFSILSTHDIALGHSTDGGYYLLGMKPPTKPLFEGIAWSTQAVFSETLRRIREQNLTYAVLPPLSDIDTKQDYQAYLSRTNRLANP